MKRTIKTAPEGELLFIGQVVKRSMEIMGTSWDMTLAGALMLGIACKNNSGMALYMLDKIDPQPDSVVTDSDVVREFPLGFEGDWEVVWNQFRQVNQRRVFER